MEIHVCAAGDVVMPLCDAIWQLLGDVARSCRRIFRGCGRLLGPCHALRSVRERGGGDGKAEKTGEFSVIEERVSLLCAASRTVLFVLSTAACVESVDLGT